MGNIKMCYQRTDTYTVNVECSNCDYVGTAELPKGKPFNEAIECPNCGCISARKQSHGRQKAGDILPFKRNPFEQHPYFPPMFNSKAPPSLDMGVTHLNCWTGEEMERNPVGGMIALEDGDD